MKTILLISNEVFHYRQKVYNYFYHRFRQDGYDFRVLSNKFQDVGYKCEFLRYEYPIKCRIYIKMIREIRPDYVIVFLHLKDRIMLPVIRYCRLHHIPVIFWNIGINAQTPNAVLKNALFHHIHNLCDALITYTPETRKYFSKKNQKKLFVAYNTLNLTDVNKQDFPSKEEIKRKYGIKEDKVILYISRMMPYKKVDLLMKCFADADNVAVVMVGPGFSEKQKAIVATHKNLYYLGEKYGREAGEIYKIGDIFSTPGHIGLAVTEAMFWGLPIVLLKGRHAPEAYYIKNGITGYFAEDEEEFKTYVLDLLNEDERRQQMSAASLEVYDKEIDIERMYQGFKDAVHYCQKKKSS